jgi:hypothetical protein
MSVMRRFASIAVVLAASAAAAGCVTVQGPRCEPGQSRMRTAQLFFGRDIDGKSQVSEAQFSKFVDQEITPRFPTGLTVLDGGGQWQGPENRLIREASKIVVLVLPEKRAEEMRKLGEVRQAYVQRFKQDSVMMVTQKACVAF